MELTVTGRSSKAVVTNGEEPGILRGLQECVATRSPAAQLAKTLLGGAVPAHYKDEAWTRAFFTGATAVRD